MGTLVILNNFTIHFKLINNISKNPSQLSSEPGLERFLSSEFTEK